MAVLDETSCAQLRAIGSRRRFRARSALFREGDPAGTVFLVDEGRVKITMTTPDGRGVMVGILGPCELVGELSALDGGPRSAAAIAMVDVRATAVRGAAYRSWLRERPDILLEQLVMVVGRLRDSDARRVELSSYDVDRRVARRLDELARHHGERLDDGSIRITVPLSQEELGEWAGASREAVARTLGRMREAGIIETTRKGYLICDPQRLRRLAGDPGSGSDP